ncbi:MAG: UDP-glucose 4-epimerase GalE [Rhizobiaceae bacterium]
MHRSRTGKRILVTGGAGYIGAHCCVALADAGFEPVVYDNFSNARRTTLDGIRRLAGRAVPVVEGDVLDTVALRSALADGVGAVIHLAGLKAVGPSLADPLGYYRTNVGGTLALVDAMRDAQVRTLVFSSSAAVYGPPVSVPVAETAMRAPANPYARTKAAAEDLLADLAASDPEWRILALRYFNPLGAHESALIGEDSPHDAGNIMPWLLRAADGGASLSILGEDYPTPDGTGVRDFVHVMDIAEGHVAALRHLAGSGGFGVVNLGAGQGVSVLDLVIAFERATGKTVSRRGAPRRAGDIAATWADIGLARTLLGWQPRRDLETICLDAWRWHEASARRGNGVDG